MHTKRGRRNETVRARAHGRCDDQFRSNGTGDSSMTKLTITAALIMVVAIVLIVRYADEIDGAGIQIDIPAMGVVK